MHAMFVMMDKLMIPFWIAISLGWLIYALDVSSVCVFLGMTIFSFGFNYKLSSFMSKYHKEREEEEKVAREEFSQTLTHVKFLKQYGLKDFFFKRCCDS